MENMNLPACIPNDDGDNNRLFHPRAWLYYVHGSNPGVWHRQQCKLMAQARDAGYEVVGCTGDPHQGTWLRRLHRPGLSAMRRAVRKGLVDVVVITRLSQLANNKRALRRILRFLARYKVGIHTTDCQLGYDLYRHGLDNVINGGAYTHA